VTFDSWSGAQPAAAHPAPSPPPMSYHGCQALHVEDARLDSVGWHDISCRVIRERQTLLRLRWDPIPASTPYDVTVSTSGVPRSVGTFFHRCVMGFWTLVKPL